MKIYFSYEICTFCKAYSSLILYCNATILTLHTIKAISEYDFPFNHSLRLQMSDISAEETGAAVSETENEEATQEEEEAEEQSEGKFSENNFSFLVIY